MQVGSSFVRSESTYRYPPSAESIHKLPHAWTPGSEAHSAASLNPTTPGTHSAAALLPLPYHGNASHHSLATSLARYVHQRHTPAAATAGRRTAETRNVWSFFIGAGAGGGKLVSSVGANAVGAYFGNSSPVDLSIGIPLIVVGAVCATLVAIRFFGPDARFLYPDNAWPLKTVSVGAALMMISGGLLSGWGAAEHHNVPKYLGISLFTLGNGMMSISFRNFTAISELRRGRLTLSARLATSSIMAGVSLGALVALNLIHRNQAFSIAARASILSVASVAFALSLGMGRIAYLAPPAPHHPNVLRQTLGAVAIAAMMGTSAANGTIAYPLPLKAAAVTLAGGLLFGAVAIDESERLRQTVARLFPEPEPLS